MGYPMTWSRFLARNALRGNYTKVLGSGDLEQPSTPEKLMIAGDLRRLEQDSVDGRYATQVIADRAGVEPETVIKVLKAFFTEAPHIAPHDGFCHADDHEWVSAEQLNDFYPDRQVCSKCKILRDS